METTAQVKPARESLAIYLLPAAGVLCLFPFVSTGMGLLLGLVLALAFGNPWPEQTRKATHILLPVSVIGLGAGMDLRVVARVGAHGIGYTVLGISIALALGALLVRLLRVNRNLGTLITVGTAICGGSAIAAIVPVLRPKDHETSIALATVFLLNAVALFVFPPIGHAVGLGDAQFGLWSALAIHDTSSVVGASMKYGAEALAIGTTVKLARALWIVPVCLATAALHRSKAKVKWPWFILYFVLAAALSTFFPSGARAWAFLNSAAKAGLTATLFLIGTAISRDTLRKVGPRPLVQAVALWALVGGVSLALIRAGLIG